MPLVYDPAVGAMVETDVGVGIPPEDPVVPTVPGSRYVGEVLYGADGYAYGRVTYVNPLENTDYDVRNLTSAENAQYNPSGGVPGGGVLPTPVTPVTGVNALPVPGTRTVVITDQNGNPMGTAQTDDPNVTSITTRPIEGTNTVSLWDQNGNYLGTAAAAPAAAPTLGELPTGFVPIKDVAGNTIGYESDPTYQAPKTYYGDLPTGFVPIKDTAGNIVSYETAPTLPGTTLEAAAGLPGLYTVKDANGNIVDVGGTYDPTSDRDFLEKVRQFDATLAVDIKRINADIAQTRMREAGASERQAASLKAQRENLEMELASRMAIASAEIAGRWRQSVLGAATDVRGQNVAMRGQDVSREANILAAQTARAQFAVQALGNDPIRQSIYLTGGSGGTTPLEQFASQYQVPSLPSIGTVGPLDPNVAKGFAGGGVVRSNQPVLSIVGESNPSAAEAALLPPGSAIEPLRLPANASKAEMERAAFRAYPRLQKRLASFQGGGGVASEWSDPWERGPQPQKPSPSALLSGAPSQWLARGEQRRAADVANRAARAARTTPTATVAPPPAPAPAPVTLTPEDMLLFGTGGARGGQTFGSQADLEAARQTVAEQLAKANVGYQQPAYMGLPAPEPLYGQTLQQPGQLAARFWGMPQSLRDLYVSGWGVRNMPRAEVYRQMQAVTPSAMQPFNVAWGRRGMAVLPMRRMVAA